MFPRAGQNRQMEKCRYSSICTLSVHLFSLFFFHCEFRIDKNEHFKKVCISSPAPDLSAGL